MNSSQKEIMLDDTSLLVSETDSKGNIIYANDTFLEVAQYSLEELIGKPHNIIRHPDMPRSAFKNLWENRNFYWVYATVFPYGDNHYLSVRKMATRDEIEKYEKIYKKMCQEER